MLVFPSSNCESREYEVRFDFALPIAVYTSLVPSFGEVWNVHNTQRQPIGLERSLLVLIRGVVLCKAEQEKAGSEDTSICGSGDLATGASTTSIQVASCGRPCDRRVDRSPPLPRLTVGRTTKLFVRPIAHTCTVVRVCWGRQATKSGQHSGQCKCRNTCARSPPCE